MDRNLPGILITGASGFAGRNFVRAVLGKFRLVCMARRPQAEAEIPRNDNLLWLQVDIGKWEAMRDLVPEAVRDFGGIDFVLHLAAFYDFTNEDNPLYKHTNVIGTRNVLELAKLLKPKRFLFASSLAACKFPSSGQSINELTPPDADFPYARSKRMGEEMVSEYSRWFPCTIIRMAALFSDWCEYPPLYIFLSTWLSRKWNSRVLGGRGESAVPHIHVQDLIKMYLRVMEKSRTLPRFCTYIASPNGSTTQLELFRKTTAYYFGRKVEPIFLPKILVVPGLAIQQLICTLFKRPLFERLWMVQYLDRQLNIDADRTYNELSWKPTPRYEIMRRILFLLENMKHHQSRWHILNQNTLKRGEQRINLLIYDIMTECRDDFVEKIFRYVTAPEHHTRFRNYTGKDANLLRWHIILAYKLITTVVRTRDSPLIRSYAELIAFRRFLEGFDFKEVCDLLFTTGNIIADALKGRAELKTSDMGQGIYDHVNWTIQLAVDEIEDSYELLSDQSPDFMLNIEKMPILTAAGDIKRVMHQLEIIRQDMAEDRIVPESVGDKGESTGKEGETEFLSPGDF
ncbi:MAG: NAD(P)-dependent oxidoreductase [Thermodesulfobacteriota bacterium]|nr:NAD(P)-dependent oxidoreductase [Thermodesulfobacteriota bacterium]